jgi:hypothetical protein
MLEIDINILFQLLCLAVKVFYRKPWESKNNFSYFDRNGLEALVGGLRGGLAGASISASWLIIPRGLQS